MKDALATAGAQAKIVSQFGGRVRGASGETMEVDKMFVAAASVMFDAVFVPGGAESVTTLRRSGEARHFINEAFRHCKPIAATGEGVDLLRAASLEGVQLSTEGLVEDSGVVTAASIRHGLKDRLQDAVGGGPHVSLNDFAEALVQALAAHRFWQRPHKDQVPA